MGSSVWLDIVGSTTTFGLLLLIALRVNAGSNESTGAYYDNYMLQTNMLTLTLMLETDLRDIGKSYTRTNTDPTPIRTATPKEFSFMIGTDLIDWIVGDTIEYNSQVNPHLRYIRRNVNGVEHKMDVGLTKMTFKYWNLGSATDTLRSTVSQDSFSLIGPVDVTIQLESPYKLMQQVGLSYMQDTTLYEIYWRQIRSVARSTLVQSQ
jgi:hypothetical protein